MSKKRNVGATATPDGCLVNPFVVAIDSNERNHGYDYKFEGLRSNVDQGSRVIVVPKVYRSLDEADYQVDGLPGYAVERKQKSDLFSSMATHERRTNFKQRLEYLQSNMKTSSVVIEASMADIFRNPATYYDRKANDGKGEWKPIMSSKNVLRTIQSWAMDYPSVHWWFAESRIMAEAWTFRALEKHWEKHRES